MIIKLIKFAEEYRSRAYTPYSKFKVGAAVLTNDNRIYGGNNIEISSYSPTICAERTAIFKAISEGETQIKKIAIVGSVPYTYPCGVCRQVISEFCCEDLQIIIAKNPSDYKIYSMDDLLPYRFGPKDVKNV